jgi:2-dehydro-3-deoxygluconokinase
LNDDAKLIRPRDAAKVLGTLDVLDRVGGGDGFASGFFYGLLSGAEPDEALKLGWAHGALLTTFPGDTTMASLEQVLSFAKGGSARIQR